MSDDGHKSTLDLLALAPTPSPEKPMVDSEESEDEFDDDPELDDDEEDEPDCGGGDPHRWELVTPPGALVDVSRCQNCKQFDLAGMEQQINSIVGAATEPLHKTINQLGGDVSGLESDLRHKQTELDNLGDKAASWRREAEFALDRRSSGRNSARRETRLVAELDRVLDAMAAMVPYMDREGSSMGDLLAQYTEMASRVHKFFSAVRREEPDHPAWTQQDAMGVASVLIRERQHLMARLKEAEGILRAGDLKSEGGARWTAYARLFGIVTGEEAEEEVF